MWNYEKRLQYPINITRPNAKIAQVIISQYGGAYRNNIWLRESRYFTSFRWKSKLVFLRSKTILSTIPRRELPFCV